VKGKETTWSKKSTGGVQPRPADNRGASAGQCRRPARRLRPKTRHSVKVDTLKSRNCRTTALTTKRTLQIETNGGKHSTNARGGEIRGQCQEITGGGARDRQVEDRGSAETDTIPTR